MPLAFTELYNGPTTDTDGNAVRRFAVPASTEAAAINYTGDPNMPVVGQAHPRIPELKCSRVSVGGRFGTEGWEVVATYAAPGTSFSFNPVDKGEAGSKWLEVGTGFREVNVPYFVRRDIQVPEFPAGQGPPTLTAVPTWEAPEVPIRIGVRQITYRRVVNVPSLASGAEMAVSSKLNTIQQFPNGLRYLFTGFQISQDRVNSYQLTYEWIYEPPTDLTTALAPVSDANNYIVLASGAGGRRILPQYHGFLVGLAYVANPPVPVIYTAALYNDDLSAWSTFPGSPIP